MKFPSTLEFLETFGLEPVDEDPSMAFFRYLKSSDDGRHELDFSFGVVSKSFQIVLKFRQEEVVSISSENVRAIEIEKNGLKSCVRVIFEIKGIQSEAVIKLEPFIHCHWWLLSE